MFPNSDELFPTTKSITLEKGECCVKNIYAFGFQTIENEQTFYSLRKISFGVQVVKLNAVALA